MSDCLLQIFWKNSFRPLSSSSFISSSFVFWNIGHSPIEAHLWTPKSQNRNKCTSPTAHLFSFLTKGIASWTLCKLYGIKLRCFWGTTWEHDGSSPLKEKKIGPLMRASWAFSLAAWTFMSETGDIPPPPATPKRKKTGPLVRAHWAFSLAAWTFISQNCLLPFLTVGNGRGTTVRHNRTLIKAFVTSALHEMFWMKNNKFILICNN